MPAILKSSAQIRREWNAMRRKKVDAIIPDDSPIIINGCQICHQHRPKNGNLWFSAWKGNDPVASMYVHDTIRYTMDDVIACGTTEGFIQRYWDELKALTEPRVPQSTPEQIPEVSP